MTKTASAPPPTPVRFAPVANCPYTQADVDIIGPVLFKLAKEGDGVTTKAIVAAAKDKSSPIHPYFQWDKDKAAEIAWRATARRMARAVKIEFDVVEQGRTVTKSVHALHFVVQQLTPGEGGAAEYAPKPPDPHVTRPRRESKNDRGAYVAFTTMTAEPEYVNQLVHVCARELKALKAKYQQYKDVKGFDQKFAAVWQAIDDLV